VKYDAVMGLYYVEIPRGPQGSLLSMKSNGDCLRCEIPDDESGPQDKFSSLDHDDYLASAGAVFSTLLRTPIDIERVNYYWCEHPAYYWEIADDEDAGLDVLYCSPHRRYLPCRYCDPGGR
jgi:hypothetical protein